MMRLINEDDVLEIVERVTNEAIEKRQPKHLIQPRIICEIVGLPTVEAQPVKRGSINRLTNAERYEMFYKSRKDFDGKCSECGAFVFDTDKLCSMCGAVFHNGKDGDGDDRR